MTGERMANLTNYQRWKLMQYKKSQPEGGYHEWARYDPAANRYQVEQNRLKRESGEFLHGLARAASIGGAISSHPRFARFGAGPAIAVGAGGLALETFADADIAHRDRRAAELEVDRQEIERRRQQGR
jgi:hypothetical protein